LTQQTGLPILKRRRLREILLSKPYDVVHFHNVSLIGPAVLKIAAKLSNAVILYTMREHWLICPMHVLWKFNSHPCDRPECLRCMIRARRPPALWRYTRLLEQTCREVDQFLAPSRFTANMHASRGFLRPVAHLASFVERDDGAAAHGTRPHQRPYCLFAGRLEAIKGAQTLISIWNRVKNVDLLIAGTGTFELRLRTLANDNPRIRFLGQLSQERLAPYYSHALALIVPTLTYEVFPLVTLESFARKTPVIGRELGGIPEAIRESGGGYVYRTDDELIEAITAISGRPELRRTLGENGFRGFEKKWSPEVHLANYFAMLEQVSVRKLGTVPWRTPRANKEKGGQSFDDVE
ncbi:MAG: glycosyltransferase, partial [Gammaproteobacteria bacterium]|nr:glycosyltransferase [Gammaproteobacteria bacterium]